jgi:hypothetical protein
LIGLFSAITLIDPSVVLAAQCIEHPGAPQQGCGVTFVPVRQAGLPLIITDKAPGPTAAPPAEFTSPILTAPGIFILSI